VQSPETGKHDHLLFRVLNGDGTGEEIKGFLRI
jgi:hypothetical protein